MYDDESKKGMYIATITCAPDGYGPVETEGRHNVALVLNTASDEAPVLVSSEAFTVWVSEAPEPWIGVDTQTGELVEGTAGTATYEIQTENVADDAPVTVAWCDAQGAAAEAPTGIVAPTDAVVADNTIALTFEVAAEAAAGDYYFTVSAGGATSDVMMLTVAADGEIDNVLDKITDPNFKAALTELMNAGGWDTDENGKLSPTEAATVTGIMDVSGKGIGSMTGIEYFTALTELYCAGNALTTLDVSKNTALIELSCYANDLTALDVTKNTALEYLYCYGNALTTTLDVTKNTKLTTLYCFGNALTALDVTKNTALTDLYCGDGSTELTVTVDAVHDISTDGNLKVYAGSTDTRITALDTPANGVTVTAGGTSGDNITIGGADDPNEEWED